MSVPHGRRGGSNPKHCKAPRRPGERTRCAVTRTERRAASHCGDSRGTRALVAENEAWSARRLGAIEGGRDYEALLPNSRPVEISRHVVHVLDLAMLIELKRGSTRRRRDTRVESVTGTATACFSPIPRRRLIARPRARTLPVFIEAEPQVKSLRTRSGPEQWHRSLRARA